MLWINQFLVGGLVYSFGELLWKDRSVPASAPVLEGALLGTMVVRVAAGGFHSGAVSEQGHVYTWGENTGGQCGLTERGSEKTITGTLQWLGLGSPFPFFLPLFGLVRAVNQ